MKRLERIKTLFSTAEAFLLKSQQCTKLSDVTAFADLALKLQKEADALEGESKLESVFVYLSFITNFDYEIGYADYLEFCLRNAMPPICEEDYLRATKSVQPRG
jgi:hypothetical protein